MIKAVLADSNLQTTSVVNPASVEEIIELPINIVLKMKHRAISWDMTSADYCTCICKVVYAWLAKMTMKYWRCNCQLQSEQCNEISTKSRCDAMIPTTTTELSYRCRWRTPDKQFWCLVLLRARTTLPEKTTIMNENDWDEPLRVYLIRSVALSNQSMDQQTNQ